MSSDRISDMAVQAVFAEGGWCCVCVCGMGVVVTKDERDVREKERAGGRVGKGLGVARAVRWPWRIIHDAVSRTRAENCAQLLFCVYAIARP